MASADTPPTARRRPLAVTIAAGLLYAVAAIQLIGVALGAALVGRQREVLDDLYANATDGAAIVATRMNLTVVSLVIGGVLAVAFAVLGLLISRRNVRARKLMFWIGIPYLCCMSYGAAFNAASSGAVKGAGTKGGPDPQEVANRLAEAGPSWYPGLSQVLATITVVWVLAVVLLLAVPPAREYFRQHATEPEPPARASGKVPPAGNGE